MKRIYYYLSFMLIALSATLSSCSGDKTYAERLEDEKTAIRNFVANQKISATDVSSEELEVYTDQAAWDEATNKHFELAKWYKFENGVYMRINDFGDTTEMFKSRDNIVIRYKETYDLISFTNFDDSTALDNLAPDQYWLLNPWTTNYGNNVYTDYYGIGIAFPIVFLGNNANVSLIVPSKAGTQNDQSAVVPYYYGSVKYILSYQ